MKIPFWIIVWNFSFMLVYVLIAAFDFEEKKFKPRMKSFICALILGLILFSIWYMV